MASCCSTVSPFRKKKSESRDGAVQHDAQVLAGDPEPLADLVLRLFLEIEGPENLRVERLHQIQRPQCFRSPLVHEKILQDVRVGSRHVVVAVVELHEPCAGAVLLEQIDFTDAEDELAEALGRDDSVRHAQLVEHADERLLDRVVDGRLRESPPQLDRQSLREVLDEMTDRIRVTLTQTAQILRIEWITVHQRSPSGTERLDRSEVPDYGVAAARNSIPLLWNRGHVRYLS